VSLPKAMFRDFAGSAPRADFPEAPLWTAAETLALSPQPLPARGRNALVPNVEFGEVDIVLRPSRQHP
jgi:hypothetical protein